MKKAIIYLATLAILAISIPVMASDVVVTVTVPDAYVARLTAMIEAKYTYQGCFDCTGLTVKECFTKMSIVEVVKKELFQWERKQARKAKMIEADASVTYIEVIGE